MKNTNIFRILLLWGLFFLWTVPYNTIKSQTVDKDILFVRKKVVKQLMDTPVNYKKVETLIQTFRNDSTWPDIDYTNFSREAFDHRRHLTNLEALSLAYRKKGSAYKGNKTVKQIIEKGLAYWVKHDFQSENWYSNEIGTPISLSRILLVIDEALSREVVEGILPIAGRANMNASGARPSGDRIKIAGIQAHVALFRYDEATVKELIRIIEGEIKFSTGRGMKQDYSFHHRPDKVNNTLHYGLNYANTFAEWADLVAETSFRFSDESVNQLIDFYLDGICKQMVYGRVRDMGILNRDISRRGEITVFSSLVPTQLSRISVHRRNELQNIIRAREGQAFERNSFAWHYWLSDHFVFQSPLYYSSVRMYSNRNANMEEPYNGEGFYNHFRGDGTNHISIHGNEYKDIAPFFDWRKVPGATILNKNEMPPESDLQKQGLTSFVGAVTNSIHGAAGFDFISPHEPLRAKKAWFFFENGYVCLGTDISSTTNTGAITTLNQCLLAGDVMVKRPDSLETLEEDTDKYVVAQWVLHNGVGYYFPEPAQITVSNRNRTGSFSDINRQISASAKKEEKGIFTLWINHRIPTRKDKYCYMVIPQMDEEKLEIWCQDNPFTVISNTSSLQAVYCQEKELAYGVFYQGGTLSIEGKPTIEVDHPGLLLVQYEGDQIKSITVSDPEQRLLRFYLTVSSPGISQIQKRPVVIELPQGEFAGKSVTVYLM